MPYNYLILCRSLLLCLQSFAASGPFPVSQLFPSSGQNIGASVSVLPMNIQGWFFLGLTGLFSLQSKGLSRVFSSTTVWKHQFFSTQPCLLSNSHMCTSFLESFVNVFLMVICFCQFNWQTPNSWTSEGGGSAFLPNNSKSWHVNNAHLILDPLVFLSSQICNLGELQFHMRLMIFLPCHPLQGSPCCTA